MKFLKKLGLMLIIISVISNLIIGGKKKDTKIDFSIKYEKYTLPNGLDVILHEDHSDPIVALATLIHAGSNREKKGKTGFAHFFEHMSFNDSENVPRGANRKMIEELGGDRNGGTSNDMTVYYEVVPKDAFEKLLWIDSDRLGYMINTVTEWALENEKQVVKNEKRQRVDNSPYGFTGTVISKNLYPENHPYNWTVIGDLEDLQAATLDDVKEFYKKYYGPNNATLIIAGDIDIKKTKKLINQWFGEIKKGPEVKPLKPMPVKLKKSKSLYYLDNFANLPELRITIPTVEQYHKDSYALNILASILGSGKRAPFYKVIVEKKKLAPSVGIYAGHREIAGEFILRVRANRGVDLDLIKNAVDEAFIKFEKDGISDKEIEKIKAKAEISFYNGISSVLGKAFQLSMYNEFAGDPGFIKEDLKRSLAVTKEDVIRVYNKYIKNKKYIMTSFVPKKNPKLIVDGSIKAEIKEEKIVMGKEKKVKVDPDYKFTKTKTKFNRTEPKLSELPNLKLPEIWEAKLKNNIKILGIKHRELPLIDMEIIIKGGKNLDNFDKIGTANILADILMEGTKKKNAKELEDAIKLLGSSINTYASSEGIHIRVNTLKKNFLETIKIVNEILLEPRFDKKEFVILKKKVLNRIRQSKVRPVSIAYNKIKTILYGKDNIEAYPVLGTEKTVNNISLDDIKNYYKTKLSPNNTSIVIAGDFNDILVKDGLKYIEKNWKIKNVAIPKIKINKTKPKSTLYFIDRPGAKQSVIFGGKFTVPVNHKDYYPVELANNRLGSGGSAKLFQTLRIKKGYTYGAYSFQSPSNSISSFFTYSSVRSNVTLESIKIFKDIIGNYGIKFNKDDLKTTKNLIKKSNALKYETLRQLIGLIKRIATYDLPLDILIKEQNVLDGISLEKIKSTVKKHINEKEMIYVIVGDGKTQLPILEKGGLKPLIIKAD